MIHIKETIIVEGKYDKERIKKLCDAPIICTDGFNIYRSKELMRTIRHLSETTGIIVLTDSDQAGFRIRNYVKNCVGNKAKIKHAYIPSVSGKEKRKEKAGKEGILGVEGMDDSVLCDILTTLASNKDKSCVSPTLTKTDLYADGLSGKSDSAEIRKKVLHMLKLPPRLSPNAMVELINRSGIYDEYKTAVKICKSKTRKEGYDE